MEALTRRRLATSTRRLKLMRKSAPDDRNGDVSHYEVPLVGAASEGEPHGFVAVRQDARTIGSHKVSVGASATSTV